MEQLEKSGPGLYTCISNFWESLMNYVEISITCITKSLSLLDLFSLKIQAKFFLIYPGISNQSLICSVQREKQGETMSSSYQLVRRTIIYIIFSSDVWELKSPLQCFLSTALAVCSRTILLFYCLFSFSGWIYFVITDIRLECYSLQGHFIKVTVLLPTVIIKWNACMCLHIDNTRAFSSPDSVM